MQSRGVDFINSSILTGTVTVPDKLNHGAVGALVVRAPGLDPAIQVLTVNLVLGSQMGSGFIVAHSSKVLTDGAMIAPVYLPAGEYAVKLTGGSTVSSAYIGFFPAD